MRGRQLSILARALLSRRVMIALSAAIRAASKSNGVWGRALLGSLLLSRIVTFASGCGPKDGDEGGRCLDSGSCEATGHCNDPSLVCNGTICEKTSTGGPSANADTQPVLPPPPSPCDVLSGKTSCPAGWSKSCVPWWAIPDPTWNGACVAQARDGQAATVFCCDESQPMCRYGEGTLVAWPANTINWSNCPGAAYLCHDLPAPPIPDAPIPNASIQCADDLPDDAGWAAACCVSGDACFVLEGHLWGSKTDSYYPRGACAPGEEEHFCTGNATLGDGPCRAAPTPEGGAPPTEPRAFCCSQGYVPPSADAGANARSDAGETDGAPDGASD